MALGYGAADMRIDMAAALALTLAEGCEPVFAGELLRQVQHGLKAAVNARRERKPE